MTISEQIEMFVKTISEPKKGEVELIHRLIISCLPNAKLWFDNGINDDNKVVNNPTIGYGNYTIHYANGTTRDFFQVGLSTNKTGISIYLMGIEDKHYLTQNFSSTIGKAKITGYCIRFTSIQKINLSVLEDAIRSGIKLSSQ